MSEVRDALTRCDADDASLLLMKVAGLGHDEIALARGLTASAVRSRIYRVRRELRLHLRGGDG